MGAGGANKRGRLCVFPVALGSSDAMRRRPPNLILLFDSYFFHGLLRGLLGSREERKKIVTRSVIRFVGRPLAMHWAGMVRGVSIVGAGGCVSLRKRTDNGG